MDTTHRVPQRNRQPIAGFHCRPQREAAASKILQGGNDIYIPEKRRIRRRQAGHSAMQRRTGVEVTVCYQRQVENSHKLQITQRGNQDHPNINQCMDEGFGLPPF